MAGILVITRSTWSCCLETNNLSRSKIRSYFLSTQNHEAHILLSQKKNIVFSEKSRQLPSMETIDLIQRLGIDYHFSEEIEVATKSLYENYISSLYVPTKLSDVSLMFRLLREAQYPVTLDVFDRFLDERGEFNMIISKDIKGMLRLYEASYLNMGEELLYKANYFCSKQLKCCIRSLNDQHFASEIQDALDHPYHITLQRYKVQRYLRKQRVNIRNSTIHDLARMDFNLVQLLHQQELEEVTRWWRSTGFAEELGLARDQSLKWYTWSMTCFTHPSFSSCRVALTKIISFIYLIDDIFDVYGSVNELCLFTNAINKWDLSAIELLPTYMRKCFVELYKVTNEIAETVLKKHGCNPIHYLKNSWVMLFNAFLVEAKWFANKQVPNAEEYLRNGIITSGVQVLLVHAFFLLENHIMEDGVNLLLNNPIQIFAPATMLRLLDDLGSAEDENQQGHDGSYMLCYMKENPKKSREEAREHVMAMISNSWEKLNKGCFSPNPFSHEFTRACLNTAQMVKVMYTYNHEQKLPLLEDLIQSMLFQSI